MIRVGSFIFLLSAGVLARATEPGFMIEDLGPGNGMAINESGQVTGYGSVPGDIHVFVWTGTTGTDLGLSPIWTHSGGVAINSSGKIAAYEVSPDGSSSSTNALIGDVQGLKSLGALDGIYHGDKTTVPAAINQSGETTGYSYVGTNGATHAFITHGTTIKDLGALGGKYGDVTSYGNDINDAGQVVGSSYTDNYAVHAFITDGAKLVDVTALAPPASISFGEAYAINFAGQATGYSCTANGTNAFISDGKAYTDLGTVFGPPFPSSVGRAINRSGQITGYMRYYSQNSEAYISDGKTWTTLGTLGGATSDGLQINNLGHVLGRSDTPTGAHVFLYNPDYTNATFGNHLLDLSALAAEKGWSYLYGYPQTGGRLLNDHDQLTGVGVINGELHAFRITVRFDAVQPQSITFPAIADRVFSAVPFALQAAASSGLPVNFSSTGPVKIASGQAMLTGVGTVRIRADQPGDAAHSPAASVLNTFVVSIAPQKITFPAVPPQVFGVKLTPGATASSGLPVSYRVISGPAQVSHGVLTCTGVGVVTVEASQSGNADWLPAAAVTKSFSVGKAAQTITFPVVPNQILGAAPFQLAATSSSGLPVTYTAFGKATVSGRTVKLKGVGPVRITSDQAGNANYLPAHTVARKFSVEAP